MTRRGLQHGSQQTGERNLEETETRREEEKLQTQDESRYPVLLKIFKRELGTGRGSVKQDAMEKESSENKKACLKVKRMKD